ncbi:hypothetical protein SAMN02910441_02415 [Ruminococcus sp. YE282]|nr:hypothetical protein SAMN02910441_02415 [Ruminococcus bromii]
MTTALKRENKQSNIYFFSSSSVTPWGGFAFIAPTTGCVKYGSSRYAKSMVRCIL